MLMLIKIFISILLSLSRQMHFSNSIEFLKQVKRMQKDALKLICNNWLEYKEAMLNTEWANAMIHLDLLAQMMWKMFLRKIKQVFMIML